MVRHVDLEHHPALRLPDRSGHCGGIISMLDGATTLGRYGFASRSTNFLAVSEITALAPSITRMCANVLQ